MLGGILILFQPSTAVGVIGVVFVVIGALLAWPGPKFAGTWYLIVLAGSLLAALSPLVALAAETLGGWMGAVGTLVILCGGVAGVPGMRDAGENV